MSKTRNLGLGFGENNQFTISLNEPNTAMINDLSLPAQVMEDIKQSLVTAIKDAEPAKSEQQSIDEVRIEEILTRVLKQHNYEAAAIAKIIPIALALIIPDILVDMNITRLAKHVMPKVVNDPKLMPLIANGLKRFVQYDEVGNAEFFDGKNFVSAAELTKNEEQAQVSLRFLKSIVISKYMKDYPDSILNKDAVKENIDKRVIEDEKNKVFQQQLAYLYNQLTTESVHGIDSEKIEHKINLADNLVYAYLIPAILDRMDDTDLKQAATLIASHLRIHNFKAIALEKYFNPVLETAEETVHLSNQNHRSLQFFAQPNKSASSHSSLKLRDKVYRFQHTHIHFEKDGEEKEYQIKDREGKLIKFDGEVHNVFEYILTKEKTAAPQDQRKRLVALGFPLQIVGSDNAAIKTLLDTAAIQELLKKITELEQEKQNKSPNKAEEKNQNVDAKLPEGYLLKLQSQIDFGKVFMNSINAQASDLLYHSWASLRSGTHGFQSGLRFIISTQPIQVSLDQYNTLKKIFGVMDANLPEKDILDPIDRKAGWRKARNDLQRELQNLTMNSQETLENSSPVASALRMTK